METSTNIFLTDIKTEIKIEQEAGIDILQLKQENVEVDVNSAATRIEESKCEESEVKIKIEEEIIENDHYDGLVQVKLEEVNIKSEEVNIKHEEDLGYDLSINYEDSDDEIFNNSHMKTHGTTIILRQNTKRQSMKTTDKKKSRTNLKILKITDLRKFNCNRCDFTTEEKAVFDEHVSAHGRYRTLYSCPVCRKTFNQKFRLDGHIVSRHPTDETLMATVTKQILQCEFCTYKCISNFDFKRHIGTHKELIPDLNLFTCEHCDYTNSDKSRLNRHLLVHSRVKPFTCIGCSKSYSEKRALDSHIVHTHSEDETVMATITTKLRECQKCSYKAVIGHEFKRHLLTHKELVTELRNYVCELCGYTTQLKYAFNNHLFIHSENKPHVCPLCDKSFILKRQFDSHKLHVHPEDEKLLATITYRIRSCEKCSYKCVSTEDYKRHLLITHRDTLQGSIIHKCDQCDHITYNKGTLNRHLLVHNSKKSFFCNSCSKGFASKCKIDRHIVCKHSEDQILMSSITNKVYECQQCSFKCIDSNDYKRHLRGRHKELDSNNQI